MIILQYLLQHLTLDYFNFSYISIFILLIICGLGIPIPEDLTLLMAGVICSLSKSNKTPLSLSGMILVCLVGILAGDSAMFFVGYFLKDKMSDFFIFRAIFKHKYYKIIQNKIAKFGYGLLFLARFLPGVRALIFVVSGSSHKIRYILFLINRKDAKNARVYMPSVLRLCGFFLR